MLTREELKEVAEHVSKVGAFKETTIDFKAFERGFFVCFQFLKKAVLEQF